MFWVGLRGNLWLIQAKTWIMKGASDLRCHLWCDLLCDIWLHNGDWWPWNSHPGSESVPPQFSKIWPTDWLTDWLIDWLINSISIHWCFLCSRHSAPSWAPVWTGPGFASSKFSVETVTRTQNNNLLHNWLINALGTVVTRGGCLN